MIDKMSVSTKDNAVLIYGKYFNHKEKLLVKEYLSSKYPNLEIYEIDGKQEIYDLYLIIN